MFWNYGEEIIGTSSLVLCREFNNTVSLFGRVDYQKFHCIYIYIYIYIYSQIYSEFSQILHSRFGESSNSRFSVTDQPHQCALYMYIHT